MEFAPIINTREDLDLLQQTNEAEYKKFMDYLKGSIFRKQDVAVYPADYNQPDYTGDKIEPIWEDVKDTSTIDRFGFTEADFA